MTDYTPILLNIVIKQEVHRKEVLTAERENRTVLYKAMVAWNSLPVQMAHESNKDHFKK